MAFLKIKNIFLFTTVLWCCNGYCQETSKDLLEKMDGIISQRVYFVTKKIDRINEIVQSAPNPQNESELNDYYYYCLNLYNEYQTFKFDSAYYYAKKLNETAKRINNPEMIANAKIQFANILISAGIFNESQDILKSVELKGLSDEMQANYYQILSRGYFDMESFSQSQEYALEYRKKGMAGYDSAMMYLPQSSWKYHSLNAQKNLKLGNTDTTIIELKDIISTYNLSNDELAVQLMSLAFSYGIIEDEENELINMTKAAIADFRGAKKEAVALLFLANKLYEKGDVIRASKYVNIALEDSRFYGSNFRLWQVSNFLPFIKAEHIGTIEKQKNKLWNYALAVTLLTIVVGISFVIIVRQIIKIRKSKRTLEHTNNKLAVSNEELMLANRIKEKYIGYYFETSSQIIDKLAKLKSLVGRRLKRKQYDELLLEVDNLNIHKEKANLYHNFDKAFLEIFPEFSRKINNLLKAEEQIRLKEGQLLNTELRIIALLRLGINDAEKLSHILDCSVNTIYAYKSKMKNKSKNPNQFEKDVMLISRVKNIRNNSLI